jgi:L-cysteine desulfidase
MALDVRVPLELLSPSPYISHYSGRSEITRCRRCQLSALCAAMNAPIPGALAVIMFLSSLQGHFEATVAAIRLISDHNLTWDDVFSRLIEEASTP